MFSVVLQVYHPSICTTVHLTTILPPVPVLDLHLVPSIMRMVELVRTISLILSVLCVRMVPQVPAGHPRCQCPATTAPVCIHLHHPCQDQSH